jgi:plastocyanin
MRARIFVCSLLLLLGYGNTASAKVWSVNVGGTTTGGGDYGGYTNPVLAFAPAQLTINAGDSVTFTNLGGAAHNVHANDNSFRCANGCDDTGGNGNPSSSEWTFTRTFNTPGTIAYHCDTHASMGMTGSIVVNAVAATINLGGYLSGNWFNPAQGGHGFQLEFTNQADGGIPSQKELVAIWFVYTPDGSGQNWIYAQGPYDSTRNTVSVPATIFHGTKFPFPLSNFDPNALLGSLGDWGDVTFTFSDCNNGTATWNSTVSGYGNGTIPLQRLTSIQGTSCPQ